MGKAPCGNGTLAFGSLGLSAGRCLAESGAAAALIAALCGAEVWLQVVLFFGVSIVLLLCLRPLSKRLLKQKKVATNADSNIGKEAIVTEEIDNLQGKGAVKIAGVEWSARSEDGSVIEKDAVVRILRIEGVKVCVQRAQET